MMTITDELDPWVNGWLSGKYDEWTALPADPDDYDWLEGFQAGCAEVAEYGRWPDRLAVHLFGGMVAMWLAAVWDVL